MTTDKTTRMRLIGLPPFHRLPALAGRHDDEDVICLTCYTVNNPTPAMRSEHRALSRKTDDFCMPFPSRCLRKLSSLPDHLVRQDEEGRRNCQVESLRGLEVDDQLEFGGLLHRQVRHITS